MHRMRARERANRREHAERVARKENNIGRMAGHVRDFRVVDELDRIRAARVVRDARVGVVHAVVFIEHHVFEYRAKSQRLKNVRLALGREVDRLRVAAAFDIEDPIVAPAVFVVAQRWLFGSAESVVLPVPLRPKSSDDAPVFLSAVAKQGIESTPRFGAK
jgi:hypothetical protein